MGQVVQVAAMWLGVLLQGRLPSKFANGCAVGCAFWCCFASLFSRSVPPFFCTHNLHNSRLFLSQAIRLFGDQVKLWATFNEPVVSINHWVGCGGVVDDV